MSRDNLEEGDSLSLETEDREDLGTGLRVTAEEEELLEEEDDDEGGGIKLAGWLPELDWVLELRLADDTAVSDTPGRLAIRKADDDLILSEELWDPEDELPRPAEPVTGSRE